MTTTAETVRDLGRVQVERVVTSGTFSLDGGTWEVDNNVWIVGDDTTCVVVDPAHQAAPILDAIGDRTVAAILCTHGHDDHITAVRELRRHTGAPVLLHPNDRELWHMHYPRFAPDGDLADGQTISVAGVAVHVLHTPGHSQGACCFHVPALQVLVSGDTLFHGGPGATGGRSFSDYDQITESIRTKLLNLPRETVVLTGHGDSTTIGDEAAGEKHWERPEGA